MPHPDRTTNPLLNAVLLQSKGHSYVFLYPDGQSARASILRHLGHMAADPNLQFSWYDAAIVSREIRSQATPKPIE